MSLAILPVLVATDHVKRSSSTFVEHRASLAVGFGCCAAGFLMAKQLERVPPIVAQEARDAPEHAQRLNGAGGLGFAHVQRLPAELIENVAHRLLCRVVVAAHAHRRLSVLELWVD